jgi:WD40-like Beta Propeller Repeat
MLCALVGVFALSVAPAQAAVTHKYLSQITEVPSGSGAPLPGLLSGLGPMTVDSGHLWGADSARGVIRINEFDAGTGGFVSQLPQLSSASGLEEVGLGVAVAHGSVYLGAAHFAAGEHEGRLAVLNEAGVLQATWTGAAIPATPATPAGSFGHGAETKVTDVAVDRSVAGLARGSVYVADPALRVVDVFGPEGVGKEPPVSEPVAAHVKVLEGTCRVEGTACEPLEVIPFKVPSHVSVDDSTGNVLVLDSVEEEVEEKIVVRSVVDVFEPAALSGFVFVRQIRLPLGLNAQNLGVDGGTGEIYVAGFQGEVDQFSPVGTLLGQITGEGSPAGDLRSPQAVAVDPASHRVFVGDYREAGVPSQPSVIDVFGGDLVIPDVLTGSVTGVTPYGARLTGTVKLDKEGEASCRFVWGTSREFGREAQCSKAAIEEESSVEAILSKATGSELEPDTTYYYRLQATNKNGLNPGDSGQDQQFTTSGPGIHEESVSNVASTSVTFNATLDPHGAPTTAYFQYGLTSGYGASVPVAPGVSVGSGEGDVEVAQQHTQALEAGTVYHYRVVVISEPSPGVFEEFDGPDQTFTTQHSGGSAVADGRSWELVTPPQKQGALFGPYGIISMVQAAVGGDAMANLASQPTEAEPPAETRGNTGYVSVLSTRGSGGWSSQLISPAHEENLGILLESGEEYRFFSEDLSLGVVQPVSPFRPLSPEASEQTAYRRTDFPSGDVGAHCQNSCFTPLVTAANTPPGTVFGNIANNPNNPCLANYCPPAFEGASPDLSHMVVGSGAQLTATPAPNGGLYEWVDGRLRLVSVMPEGEGGAAAYQGVIANPTGERGGQVNAVSVDGSRVVWEGTSSSDVGSIKHLYLRDFSKGESVRLDLPQGGTGTGLQLSPKYMTASSDGSRIFFVDGERLTADSSVTTESLFGGGDLYEYDLNASLGSRLTDLSVDRHTGEGAGVARMLGASEDGSYVYFAASGVLTPNAKHGKCGGGQRDSETCNLYVSHGGVTRLVAQLSAEDFPDWSLIPLTNMPVRVSPDGRWLAFMSDRSLTGYDMRDAFSGHPDEEVYLYDASSNGLVCASCNPTGARPVGVENRRGISVVQGHWGDNRWFAADEPEWKRLNSDQGYQPRYLSDSGRLFFDSSDALVPLDVNGAQDVYEYEPSGVGNCSMSLPAFSARSGGCIGLISSGSSPEDSAFIDASGNGGDVFFLTLAKLASQDFDSAFDVYDAHECTVGSPCFAPVPASVPACSTGDACKPSPSPQPPIFGSPSSATFSGAGNITPSGSGSVVKPRSLTRVQKLAHALRTCHRKRGKRRGACERQAHARYSVKRSSKASTKIGKG